MKILITAPSLDEERNVSGISTIVRQIMRHGRSEYVHFTAGREDGERSGPKWVIKQAILPVRFALKAATFRPDVVHINTALTDKSIIRDAALATAAKLAGRRVVVAVHGGKYLIEDFENKQLENVAGNMLVKAHSVIVYSDFEKGHIARRWPRLQIETLANAIPLENVELKQRNNTVPLVVFFGRMHESKGLNEVIDACRSLVANGFKFEVKAYGEGPIREFFVNEMETALGDRFNYGGVISGDEKWRVLGEADVFVLPSRYGEGLPMAMLEAMATGCIVIVGDVASVSTVISDGTNGYLVKPYDAPGLASKMKVVLDDKLEWATIRENAVATVRNKFEITAYIEKLEKIYESTRG
jgi:glycosyltransferase involved in cell wall biosynthesis